MTKNWRISSLSGALLAVYFIPAWTMAASRIIVSPIHGLYDRSNISFAFFISDHLQLSSLATVRFAWLLALGRITVVAFLAMFLMFVVRAAVRRSGGATEALAIALALGSIISFVGVLLASFVGETAAVRLHAAELLMMLGTVIVMLFEAPAEKPADINVAAGELSLQQT